MSFFALQIWTGTEGRFLSLAKRRAEEGRLRLLWPRRRLRIRRRGAWKDALAPIFPGYLFIQADTIDPGDYHMLKGVPGFIRFLPSNTNFVPLEAKDQQLLMHFLRVRRDRRKIPGLFRRESQDPRPRRPPEGPGRNDRPRRQAQGKGKGAPGDVRQLVRGGFRLRGAGGGPSPAGAAETPPPTRHEAAKEQK